jgi:oligopeptide transport system ATP-binding protein
MKRNILEVENITKHYKITKGLVFSQKVGVVKAVNGISFHIKKGETFGLVGESGCGKTTVAKLILKLVNLSSGVIKYRDQIVDKFSKNEIKRYRRDVQAVFQDPYSSLSPRMRVIDIISEPMVVNSKMGKNELKKRVSHLLEVVGLDPSASNLYPHEFSGGQRQRIAIARALGINPKIIILDEPISALDVSIRAQIMNLLTDIQDEFKLTYLLIAHDLAVVKHMSNRIGVMYKGKLVETADSDELYRQPLHPYTKALYSAALPLHPDDQHNEIILPGEVSSSNESTHECSFQSRCFEVKDICKKENTIMKKIDGNHEVACHLY